jgi:hypothetical protein
MLRSGDEILVGRVTLAFDVTGEQHSDVQDPDDVVLYRAEPAEMIAANCTSRSEDRCSLTVLAPV